MKRAILFFVIGCLFSFNVSGQSNPGFAGGSGGAGIDTTKLPPSIMIQSFKIPERKGPGFETGVNYNFWQQGEKNRIRLDTLFYRNSSYQYKYFEIGVTYQHTLTNTIRSNYISSDRFRGWQLGFSSPFNFR